MKYLFIFLFLIMSSCQKDFSIGLKSRNDKLQGLLNYAHDIKFNQNLINKGVVESPPNTWVSLISFQNLKKYHCLFYKIPYGDKKGILKVVSSEFKKCNAFDKGENLVEEITGFYFNFSMEESSSEKGSLVVGFQGEEKEELVIPLFNNTTERKPRQYSNQLDMSFVDDVAIGNAPKVKKIKSGSLCHGVNRECMDIVANKCDLCEEGAYEVVDFNCPQGGSKYCGTNKCGEKNMPACPRGYKVLETKLSSLCFDGSPAGFCKPGLHTFCNEDNILICL